MNCINFVDVRCQVSLYNFVMNAVTMHDCEMHFVFKYVNAYVWYPENRSILNT